MRSLPPEANLFLQFTRRLDQLASPYMVSGSVATMFYGEPRLTNDVDLILDLTSSGAMVLPALFPPPEFYCPPPEVLIVEIHREQRGHFNLIHIETAFKADVYLRGNDPLHLWALPRAHRVSVGETTLPLAPIEYVIVRKLEYFREGVSEKHLRDIQMMLNFSRNEIDSIQLERLIAQRGLQAEWARASGSRP